MSSNAYRFPGSGAYDSGVLKGSSTARKGYEDVNTPVHPVDAYFHNRAMPDYVPRLKSRESQSSSDHYDDILDKLEQTGRVPSKDKFRRMACNVRKIQKNYAHCKYNHLIENLFLHPHTLADLHIRRSVPLQR
jgi:hypothetical protein